MTSAAYICGIMDNQVKSISRLLAAVLAACTAAFLPSCERIDIIGGTENESGSGDIPDSILTVVCLDDHPAIRTADIFIYRDEGLRRLEAHRRIKAPGDPAAFQLEGGDKIVVGIANCPDSLSIGALDAYDTMEMLRFYYRDDGATGGLMSGTASCTSGDTVTLRFSTPMCRIALESVGHAFSNYRRLEDPVVFLSDVNPYVEALRWDSFTPTETLNDTSGLKGMMWERLPCDIGTYTQFPGTELYCYPNESSVTPTRLTVEGTPSGAPRCRFTTTLPPLSYGDRLSVSLEISDNPETYRYNMEKQ